MPHKRPKPRSSPQRVAQETRSESMSQPPTQVLEVGAIELKTIELRLNGIKEAAQRSRFVFIIMSIVSSVLIITLWNTSLSWDRDIVYASQHSTNPLYTALANEWIKGQVVPVGIFGLSIRVSVSDLSVIGSICMVIITMWYFYSQRRENRAIVTLLQDCAKGYKERQISKGICSMVLQGIMHSLVFIDLGKGDKPLSGLQGEEDGVKKENKSVKEKPVFLIREVVKTLVYLPSYTIILIIASDIWSLVTPSLFRSDSTPLWSVLGHVELTRIVLFELIAISSALYTWFLCYQSTNFSKATAATLIDYMEFLNDAA